MIPDSSASRLAFSADPRFPDAITRRQSRQYKNHTARDVPELIPRAADYTRAQRSTDLYLPVSRRRTPTFRPVCRPLRRFPVASPLEPPFARVYRALSTRVLFRGHACKKAARIKSTPRTMLKDVNPFATDRAPPRRAFTGHFSRTANWHADALCAVPAYTRFSSIVVQLRPCFLYAAVRLALQVRR